MVHVLKEVQRCLTPAGILIDLRPLVSQWPVEVTTPDGFQQVGHMLDDEVGLTDDAASNRAMEQAAAKGWFVQEKQAFFPLFYYWDTPNQMQEYIAEEWEGFSELDEQTLGAVRATWASAGAESRVRVRMKMLIARWKCVK